MGWDDRQEVEGRWESETSVEGDGEAVYCGKCFTETALTCKLVRSKTLVSIQVYKDVGQGLRPADPKWQALVGAWKVKRDPADFLWTRRETEAIMSRGGRDGTRRGTRTARESISNRSSLVRSQLNVV